MHARFLSVAGALTDSAHESVSGQRQSAKVEPGSVVDRVSQPSNSFSHRSLESPMTSFDPETDLKRVIIIIGDDFAVLS